MENRNGNGNSNRSKTRRTGSNNNSTSINSSRRNNRRNSNTDSKYDNYELNANDVMLFIVGLGCQFEINTRNRQFQNKLTSPYYILHGPSAAVSNALKLKTQVLCSKKMSGTLKNIAKTFCHITPSKNDSFVQGVFTRIKELLQEGKRVFLVGHSYGGSVASRVAELVNREPDISLYNKKLFVITLGSIYIPKKERLNRFHQNVFHNMICGDVATKCNKLKSPDWDSDDEGDAYIRWDVCYSSQLALKESRMFGTKLQWQLHNRYDINYIRDVLTGYDSHLVKRLREVDRESSLP